MQPDSHEKTAKVRTLTFARELKILYASTLNFVHISQLLSKEPLERSQTHPSLHTASIDAFSKITGHQHTRGGAEPQACLLSTGSLPCKSPRKRPHVKAEML